MGRKFELVDVFPGNWPFDVSVFDRTKTLSRLEKNSLERWHKHWMVTNSHSLEVEEKKLARLIEPIDIILKQHGNDLRTQHSARSFLLDEMYKRKNSFWAWSLDDWIQCIGVEYNDFRARHSHRNKSVRNYLLACAYMICGGEITLSIYEFYQRVFACRVFGTDRFKIAYEIARDEAIRMGFGHNTIDSHLPVLLSEALLASRSYNIKDVSLDVMIKLRNKIRGKKGLVQACYTLSHVLCNLGVISRPLDYESTIHVSRQVGVGDDVPEEWFRWVEKWYAVATCAPATRKARRIIITKAGRWAAANFGLTSPAQWNIDTCLAYVSAVENMKVGEWLHPKSKVGKKVGKDLSHNTKVNFISSIRAFFLDCQEFKWFPCNFNPSRYLFIPATVKIKLGPSPRVLPNDVWAKLLHAGLNLTPDDVPRRVKSSANSDQEFDNFYYPWEMNRAITMVWLFSGLRAGEVKRLTVGCVTWESGSDLKDDSADIKKKVCCIRVPINKTSGEFIKPVDALVGEAIEAWEKVRPASPPKWDVKSGKEVHYLFLWRGKYIGKHYLNNNIIPMLCKKAGVPNSNSRGVITSHWARATIASQLFNGEDNMSLLDLQDWMGHKSINSTRQYVDISITKMSKSYNDAGYFERNMRRISVLIDQDVILSGEAAKGEPWRYYDLGHGFCTYDFFEACKHRMACAKCSFYRPKQSSYMQIIEAKANLLRMQQSIPLTEEEIAAVEDGINALNKLTESLLDTVTPQGLTPREIANKNSDLNQ